MKIFTSTQIEVNNFLSDHKEYDVKSFSVDVIKSQPYITVILDEFEEDEERDVDLHFAMTSRKDGVFDIDEDGNVIHFTTFVNKNVLRYLMLVATERKDNKVLDSDGSEVDMISEVDEKQEDKSESESEKKIEKSSKVMSVFDAKEPHEEDKSKKSKGRKGKKDKKYKIETIGEDVIQEVDNT